METSIRFLRIERRGVKPALCFRGRNQAHAVINDEGCIRVVSHIRTEEHDKASIVMGPVGLGRREYPIELFVQRFEEIGRRKGMTLRAQYFLKQALAGGVPDDATLPPDTLPGDPAPVRSTADVLLGKPATAPRSPTTGKPGKPPVAPPKAAAGASDGASRTAGATLVARLAVEFKLEPPKLRKLLRAAGLRAPYTDEQKLRDALK